MKKITFIIFLIASVFVFCDSASASQITVKKGDSLWLIAKRYNVSFAEVLKINTHFDNQHMIYPNDTVFIPDGSNGASTKKEAKTEEVGKGNLTAAETAIPSESEAVLNLVNSERAKQGLKALTLSNKLTSIATTKAKDMAMNNYFSHNSPKYGSPFQMLQSFGVSYKSAGENIAAGQRTEEEVMQSWMNSSGHKANILNPNYTELGVGHYKGGSYETTWVQIFIGK